MRKIFTSFLFVVLMIMGSAVLAQDAPTTFCGSLSESDCGLLTQSASAMSEVKSAGFHFELELQLSNIPDSKPASFSFRMTGDGAYALDTTHLSALLFSPDELAQNMDKLPQMMEDAIRAISADGNFLMFFSDEMLAAMSSSATPLPSKAGFSVRLVDGTAYANLEKLADFDTKGELPRGWFGFDLAAYFRQLLEQQSVSLSQVSPLQAFNFGDASMFEKYITIERQADSTMDNQALAVFKTSVDMDALFSSEAFQTYLRQQMEQSAEVSGLSQSDLDQTMTLFQSLFDGLVIEATQSIGLEDHYTHRVTVSVNWPFDMSAIASVFGAPATSKQPPLDIQMTLQADLSQFNDAPIISAPENATIIPLDELNNLSNSFNLNPLSGN